MRDSYLAPRAVEIRSYVFRAAEEIQYRGKDSPEGGCQLLVAVCAVMLAKRAKPGYIDVCRTENPVTVTNECDTSSFRPWNRFPAKGCFSLAECRQQFLILLTIH